MNLFAYLFALALVASGQLPKAPAQQARMDDGLLGRAAAILEEQIRRGELGAASLFVARQGKTVLHQGWGKLSPAPQAGPVTPDSVFLVASITKPVTACALMILVERGEVLLDDPVSRYLPEFTGDHRERVRVRDLLSHTSGLPDMLPENIELRRAHAPLSRFVEGALKTPLLYVPREDFRYQSMGILLAGEIVERVAKMPLRDFMRREIFEPLGMKNTALGMKPGWRLEQLVRVFEPAHEDPADNLRFGPNSPYWRDMGHPWGGMHSTSSDLAVFLEAFLNGGRHQGRRWLSPATVSAMIRDQNEHLKKPWGLGWALAKSAVWMYAGELVSPQTFGHSGATGTLAWADPVSKVICVILTNRPVSVDGGRTLRQVSNIVAAAVLD
ncbi:MAG: beta-lactamase family protein [Bryobacteraceae bacterium]|nr:beta-lactamase family protein [Bryobacteraceae bacterium]MDW8376998.1 serine hydrolase domain-containing protein [Bryobacterales bacterium]